MSRMYGFYVGIKEILSKTIFTIPTVGWSDITLQRPTRTNTTIADHGLRQWKWPPSAPHEALRSAPMRRMDGQQPPKQANIIFGLFRVCMALKTLQCCGDTSSLEQRGTSRAIHTLNNPKKYTCLLEGLSAIHSTHWHGAQGLMWGTRGPFLPAVAIVVAVVLPFVFVLRLLKSAIKTLKLVACKQTFIIFIMYCKTYYNSPNTNCSVAGVQTSLVQLNPHSN
jgi:hypothetical protein